MHDHHDKIVACNGQMNVGDEVVLVADLRRKRRTLHCVLNGAQQTHFFKNLPSRLFFGVCLLSFLPLSIHSLFLTLSPFFPFLFLPS